MLALGLITVNLTPTLASNLPFSQSPSPNNFQLAQKVNHPLADGIYLYGQSPQAEKIGQEYLVFRVQQGQVIGAFYMPQSEFSCFYGRVNNRSMDISIVDPYDNTVYAHSINLKPLTPIAEMSTNSVRMGLEGYHQITQVSDNDQRILNTCLQEHH
jgi:hypothetical protein